MNIKLSIDDFAATVSGTVKIAPGDWISKGKGIVYEDVTADIALKGLDLDSDIQLDINTAPFKNMLLNHFIDVNCLMT